MIRHYISYIKREAMGLWWYLTNHPDITTLSGLPDIIYSKVKNVINPLCNVFLNSFEGHCKGCPLSIYSEDNSVRINCFCNDSLYNKWLNAPTKDDRYHYAQTIYINIKSFDISTVKITIERIKRGITE